MKAPPIAFSSPAPVGGVYRGMRMAASQAKGINTALGRKLKLDGALSTFRTAVRSK